MFSKWEESSRHFPEPNLDENKVYACRDLAGLIFGAEEFEARFCFGEGEFWWADPTTGKELRVTDFCRG